MKQNKIDISAYQNHLSLGNQLYRFIFKIIWFLLARPFPKRFANNWKIFLLRIFGAQINGKAVVYSSAKIFMPKNLRMEAYSCLAPYVDCYNVDSIEIGAHATVSQKTFLCSASHDINKKDFPLITAPIIIESQSWIGASAFIGMGVTIGEGAVVGATSSVFKDVEPWTVVGGNPAKLINKRIINE